MSTQRNLPVVAVVGRANVGKSSMCNRILGFKEAIVANEAGTTRDSVFRITTALDKPFWLVDTAGLKTAEDDFEATIQEQITEAAAAADVIVVVVAANSIISDEDRRVAKQALKSKKPVVLAVNKIDTTKHQLEPGFERLGIKDIVAISSTQGFGFEELLKRITSTLPKKQLKADDNELTIALLGRPNVGKSHLFNTLAKKQQAVVANVAGTTRDTNRADIRVHNQTIHLLDTAGIRRSGKIEVGIEKFSVLRSLQAIEEADICFLLLDAHEPVTKLDQKIAGMVKEANKGLVLVVSKWDSVEKDSWTHDTMAAEIRPHYQFVHWAPVIFTSAVSGQNVSKLPEIAQSIQARRRQTIKTSVLNNFLQDCVHAHPPAGLKNRHPKLNYIVQTDDNPASFTMYGSHLQFLHWSYKRYLDRSLRQKFDFDGTPIPLYYRDKRAEAR